jgi:hypothetical protein
LASVSSLGLSMSVRYPFTLLFSVTIGVLAVFNCAPSFAEDADVNYLHDIKPILKAKCVSCHGALKQEGGLRLDTGELARRGGDSGKAIVAGNAKESLLIERITAADESERMPPENEPLSQTRIEKIVKWIDSGAKSPVDEQEQQDPKDHWAYQQIETDGFAKSDNIDEFIRAGLKSAGLEMAEPADRLTLIRRLYFDLHGLPPTPTQIREFLSSKDPQAYDKLVEELLSSPRYGERWAQHWLDIVRYADTHGYEVNTPRPNAWPYRDYVIRAFNDDLPFDKFVYQQLVGDAVGADAATGFMVAAAVLLPGQIGQDEASKRQARQDALDEIIVGTTATFLGLTVGCARCHDHKFDPITQRDYYAMQAFFAGVDYGDRAINDATQAENRELAAGVLKEIDAIEARLAKYQPTAFAGRTILIDDEDATRVTLLKEKQGHGANPAGAMRGYKDDVGDTSRMPNLSRSRYTWWKHQPNEDVLGCAREWCSHSRRSICLGPRR